MSLHSSKVITAVLDGLTAGLSGGCGVVEEGKRPQDLGTGLLVLRRGEPGEPEVLLSPRSYSYDHRLPIEVIAPTREGVDAILETVRDWVEANRSLGGLCDWFDVEAAQTDVAEEFGTASYPYALLDLVASYTTPSPLS